MSFSVYGKEGREALASRFFVQMIGRESARILEYGMPRSLLKTNVAKDSRYVEIIYQGFPKSK